MGHQGRNCSKRSKTSPVYDDLDKIIDVDYSLVDINAYSMKEAFSPFTKFTESVQTVFHRHVARLPVQMRVLRRAFVPRRQHALCQRRSRSIEHVDTAERAIRPERAHHLRRPNLDEPGAGEGIVCQACGARHPRGDAQRRHAVLYRRRTGRADEKRRRRHDLSGDRAWLQTRAEGHHQKADRIQAASSRPSSCCRMPEFSPAPFS